MEDKKLNSIDYRPLNNMNSAWSETLRSIFKVPPYVSIVILILVSCVAFYFFGQFAIIGIVLIYGGISSRVLKRKAKIWRDFAAANGWYVIEKTQVDPLYIPPGIAGQGHSAKMGDVVHAQIDDHECDVFMYQFTVGSGKNSQTLFYTVARVALARQFPHIVLDSKATFSLRDKTDAKDTASLEGDFNQYFNLFYRKDDQINALSIITPDVMKTLIEYDKSQDIEISGSFLFFMVNSDLRTAAALPSLFKSVDALSDEIAHKAETIQYKTNDTQAGLALAPVVNQYMKSGNMVMDGLVKTLILILLMPIIFMIFVGFVINFAN